MITGMHASSFFIWLWNLSDNINRQHTLSHLLVSRDLMTSARLIWRNAFLFALQRNTDIIVSHFSGVAHYNQWPVINANGFWATRRTYDKLSMSSSSDNWTRKILKQTFFDYFFFVLNKDHFLKRGIGVYYWIIFLYLDHSSYFHYDTQPMLSSSFKKKNL